MPTSFLNAPYQPRKSFKITPKNHLDGNRILAKQPFGVITARSLNIVAAREPTLLDVGSRSSLTKLPDSIQSAGRETDGAARESSLLDPQRVAE